MEKTDIYKKWAFRLFIYVVIINIAIVYLTVSYVELAHDAQRFFQNISILSIAQWIMNIIGIVLIILILVAKKSKSKKFWIAAIGHGFFFIAGIIMMFVNN